MLIPIRLGTQDLAALLPNLASVRRPSKSAIVNSSIALIHTQRRSRATAARELRLLKLEADALRAEVNEWRERAGMGLARIEEPVRSRDFEELVSGGLEEAEESLLEEERRALEIAKEGLRMDASNGYSAGDMVGQNPFAYGNNMFGGLAEDDEEDGSSDGQTASRVRPGSQGSIGIPTLPMPIQIPRQNSMASNPMIFDPTAALLQSHTTHNAGIQNFNAYDFAPQAHHLGLTGLGPISPNKMDRQALWNQQMLMAQSAAYGFPQTFTPPTSAHGPASANFLSGFGLRDEDIHGGSDASSVGSNSIPDMGQFQLSHPQQVMRTRSASTVHQINKSGSPPTSAPATATTYAEANAAGDALAAAYGATFPNRVPGGGNTYGAAMGLFM